MGWFSRSKKKAELAAEKAALESLQLEIEQLKTVNEEASARNSELEEQLANERELIASERAQFAGEREQHSDAVANLSRRHDELTNQIAEFQQKIKLLDEANVTMAGMLKSHEADVAQKDQRVSELEADLTSSWEAIKAATTAASAQAMEWSNELAQAKNESDESAAKALELEQQVNSIQAAAAAKIAQLERSLADSEVRSEKRAEQRSALLRNMAEIHRLSMTASRTEPEPAPETLKLVQPERDGQARMDSNSIESETIKPSPYFARSSKKEMSDSDVLQ